jgi:hypothetical protein
MAAGVAMFRAHEVEGDIAAENMLSSPAVPVSTAIRPGTSGRSGSAHPLPVRSLTGVSMLRSKQQALMFLLGASLVGGAVGFSADRYIGHEKFATQYGPRSRFYDELGLNAQQRTTMDSLAFQQDCAVRQVLSPHDSALKAIRTRFQAQRDSVLSKTNWHEWKPAARTSRRGVKLNKRRSPREHAPEIDRLARRAGDPRRAADAAAQQTSTDSRSSITLPTRFASRRKTTSRTLPRTTRCARANNACAASRARHVPNLHASAGQSISAGQRGTSDEHARRFVPAWSYNSGLLVADHAVRRAARCSPTCERRRPTSRPGSDADQYRIQCRAQRQAGVQHVSRRQESEGAARAQLAAAKRNSRRRSPR